MKPVEIMKLDDKINEVCRLGSALLVLLGREGGLGSVGSQLQRAEGTAGTLDDSGSSLSAHPPPHRLPSPRALFPPPSLSLKNITLREQLQAQTLVFHSLGFEHQPSVPWDLTIPFNFPKPQFPNL